jgi:hypothetical protein
LTTPDVGLLVERNPDSIEEGLLNALTRRWDRSRIHRHVSERSWQRVAQEVKAVFELTLEKSEKEQKADGIT